MQPISTAFTEGNVATTAQASNGLKAAVANSVSDLFETKEQAKQREAKALAERNQHLHAEVEAERARQAKLPAYLRDPMKTHPYTIRQPNRNMHINACGHDTDPRQLPKHVNCPSCWTAYFIVHQAEVLAAEKIIESLGEAPLVNQFGKKYVKHIKAAIAVQRLRHKTEAQNAELQGVTQ